MDELKHTPRPRELNEEELNRMGLVYFGGKPFSWVIETTGNVWAYGDTGRLPVYRYYYGGTNCVKIVKYNWNTDEWFLNEMLGGALWLLLLDLGRIGYHYSDWENHLGNVSI